ncbi:PPOX class probable F420-dependent enzyme [Nonomuraea thailandensis]|uniref:PPOX class probable F420-dependent enzyme n=1 Tax=Nonomuraea thailandensis TaxID=1188745 RepID=A0A9X2GWH1_9ACTN|nr:PPOX class F420-dependent oxidoreductase [Nonomuraea thailandensis]MCP2365195.1 PPOX class probable F420-dependent enzyme [Nonomuraea thailandensis]
MNLGTEQYISVTTYRKDGTPVATPVWVVQDGDAAVIWTTADSGKIKRIRNNPDVTVAGCDVRGNVRTPPVKGRAELLGADETERVRGLIRRKYGLVGRLVLLGSRLRRGDTGTVAVRITDI